MRYTAACLTDGPRPTGEDWDARIADLNVGYDDLMLVVVPALPECEASQVVCPNLMISKISARRYCISSLTDFVAGTNTRKNCGNSRTST